RLWQSGRQSRMFTPGRQSFFGEAVRHGASVGSGRGNICFPDTRAGCGREKGDTSMNTLEHNAMALNDWSQSEPAPKQEFEKTTAEIDLTLEICSEDRSHTQFYQNNENGISKILRLLITPQLFTQPFLTMVSGQSISTVPCRTIDMILVRTQALPPLPPLLLPPGLLDIV